jgi:hypothetical protein
LPAILSTGAILFSHSQSFNGFIYSLFSNTKFDKRKQFAFFKNLPKKNLLRIDDVSKALFREFGGLQCGVSFAPAA